MQPNGNREGRNHTLLQAKRIREEKRKTLQETSDAIGVSKSTLSRFENGLRDLRSRHLILLADYLEAAPADLLEREAAVA